MKTILYVLGLVMFFLTDLHAQPILNLSQSSSGNVLLSWAATNSGFGLEYADSLDSTNWQQIQADVTNGQCVVMDSGTSSTRYFRLVSPFGTNLPPTLPPGANFVGNGDASISQIPQNPTAFTAVANLLTGPAGLDASAVIDPSSPTNDSLSYLWIINANDQAPDLISPDITGTSRPVITFNNLSLTDDMYFFTLTVTSNYSGLSTTYNVTLTLTGSSVSEATLTDDLYEGVPPPYTVAIDREDGSLLGYSEVVGYY